MMMQKPKPKKKVVKEQEQQLDEEVKVDSQIQPQSDENKEDQKQQSEEQDNNLVIQVEDKDAQEKQQIAVQQEQQLQQEQLAKQQKEQQTKQRLEQLDKQRQQAKQQQEQDFKDEYEYLFQLRESQVTKQDVRYPTLTAHTEQNQVEYNGPLQQQSYPIQEPQNLQMNINSSAMSMQNVQQQAYVQQQIMQPQEMSNQVQSAQQPQKIDLVQEDTAVTGTLIKVMQEDYFYNPQKVQQEEAQIQYDRRPTVIRAKKLHEKHEQAEKIKQQLEQNTKQYEEQRQEFNKFLVKKVDQKSDNQNQVNKLDGEHGQMFNQHNIAQLEVRYIDGTKYLVHQVTEQDSLMNLSIRYKTTQKIIMQMNNLTNDMIFQRKELLFPYREIDDAEFKQTIDADKIVRDQRANKIAKLLGYLRNVNQQPQGDFYPEAKFYLEEASFDLEQAKQMYKDDQDWQQEQDSVWNKGGDEFKPM